MNKLIPQHWLQRQPLMADEQLFAVLSSTSDGEPFKVWSGSTTVQTPSPIWADTIYAEWDTVMPFVGIVAVDSEFLDWVATTESRDWGWLAVSSASPEVVVEHFRSLTQALMPDGKTVFFRFWDGRFLLPILQSDAVDSVQLLPVISRGLINGQAIDIGGVAQVSGRVFPWWKVPDSVLVSTGDEVRVSNTLQWLSEEHPPIFEAFPEPVLRCKVRQFFQVSVSEDSSQLALLAYLRDEDK
jgi:hypothetical protein